jgi:predicted dehydrogenase
MDGRKTSRQGEMKIPRESGKQMPPHPKGVSRRDFLRSTAAAGAGAALAPAVVGRAATLGSKDLNIALIGAGEEGRVLMDAMMRIPGVRFRAVCDIWDWNRGRTAGLLKKSGHDVNEYVDYQDMLAAEKNLDAAIVATPDWVHAEHAIACMEAGLDVYCEKEMSNDLAKARQMVLAARKTGKLLQIGHQRRSNPRYHHAINTLIHEVGLLGRITHANAQWNRAKKDDFDWPKGSDIDQETLHKYGYDSMHHFRNWRWYKKYGGGPVVDLGSHQIDIFTWVFKSNPKAVAASGGIDFYDNHEWYDNVMAIFDYDAPEGKARAFYQVLTTTSQGLFYETFMGVDGSLVISELHHTGNRVLREQHAPPWDIWVRKGLLLKTVSAPIQVKKDVTIDVRATPPPPGWPLPIELNKPPHQPHLENFFDAVRNGAPLNCPAEIGYETAVAVLKVNDAVDAGRKLDFKPEEFEVHA